MSQKGFYFFHISILILEVSTSLLQPEYSVKIFNTENIVLSMGDVDDEDDNDDLEIIKTVSENPELERKLEVFHKFVKIMRVSDRPKEKLFLKNYPSYSPAPEVFYPDPPFATANDRKHSARLHRKRKKKMHWLEFKKGRRRQGVNRWGIAKRELTTPETETEYADLEKKYEEMVAQSKRNNTAYKYTDEGKPEENFKEVIKKITDLKTPKNCTNVTGIGLQAMECLVKNAQNNEIGRRELINKISLILLIWIGAYLLVALPLWCSRGWCCCCCRCAFCLPKKTVREIQKYIADNPPGVYVNEQGEKELYTATAREGNLYEKLKKLISEF